MTNGRRCTTCGGNIRGADPICGRCRNRPHAIAAIEAQRIRAERKLFDDCWVAGLRARSELMA